MAIGRVVSGALWGLGAAAALAVVHGDPTSARSSAKRVVKACVLTADRLQELAATTRETIEDLYAEVRAEQTGAPDADWGERRQSAAGVPITMVRSPMERSMREQALGEDGEGARR